MRQVDKDYLHLIRAADLDTTIGRAGQYFEDRDALEIGSGTGYQLSLLKKVCRTAKGIDLPRGRYSEDRVEDVLEYDGRNIPFDDHSFDLVFSSNVLEHISDLKAFHREMHRVLRNDGIAVHILPSHCWRLWQTLLYHVALVRNVLRKMIRMSAKHSNRIGGSSQRATEARASAPQQAGDPAIYKIVGKMLPDRHGERGNFLTEWRYFHPDWWRLEFESNGWKLVGSYPTGIFHSGYHLLGHRLTIKARRRLTRFLGSSTYIYVMKNE